jgi:hypothetical protein
MKTYSILFAEDVPHYGFAEIEAEDDAAAIEAAKDYDLSEVTTDPEWENSVCKRIVHIEGPDGKTIAADIALDDCFLRNGGEKDRILCDAAWALLNAGRLALRELREFYLDSDSQAIAELKAAIAKATGGAP